MQAAYINLQAPNPLLLQIVYGGEMFYSSQEFADELVDQDEMGQLLSYGFYKGAEPLLLRIDRGSSTLRLTRRSGGMCQTRNLISK